MREVVLGDREKSDIIVTVDRLDKMLEYALEVRLGRNDWIILCWYRTMSEAMAGWEALRRYREGES